uniref:Heme oxygenase n=1 Tax=Pyropia perforata TaxID=182771 RepID=A0A023HRM4_PYRPE|nr:heme oxygenase [Neoporphyra perforata]AGQ17093.1 heme oxygenase [Neoporphyra perforata]AHB35258.1 heme oxygenase [Neoporphyra perforata]AIA19420.1 heme oxygenase [Neoporphyra perforata]AIA20674.1 heme oxygenase [Neoporphyra perforata]AIA21092.1 heme oxygenase [Neoporphyra perforata]
MVNTLANELREGTTKSHSMAENVSFVKSFLGGVVDKKSYSQLVANLYFVYCAIEDELFCNKDHPVIKPIYFTELNRKISLSEDLSYYYGSDWLNLIKPSPATKIYVERIHSIGSKQPELLVAHAYTRYLGDLSGGQILKKIARGAMNLSDERGTKFYDFDQIQDDTVFKDKYRAALNMIPVSDHQIQNIVSEANISFTLNMKMFEELNSSTLKIITLLIANTIQKLKAKYKTTLAAPH